MHWTPEDGARTVTDIDYCDQRPPHREQDPIATFELGDKPVAEPHTKMVTLSHLGLVLAPPRVRHELEPHATSP